MAQARLTASVALPSILLRLTGTELPPEFTVLVFGAGVVAAAIFAWRLHRDDGLGMLLSAKVNQWTLLVGSLRVAYSRGGGAGGTPAARRPARAADARR